MKRFLLALALTFTALPVSAQTYTGFVTGNHDGDTVEITLTTGEQTIVRLANVDAPELHAFDWQTQPFGQRAKRALCDLICGKTVSIDYVSEYPYQHAKHEIVGDIHAPFDVSEEMVREGMAWNYPRYNTDPAMPGIEAQARAGHLGLWAQPGAIPPWEWRHAGMR